MDVRTFAAQLLEALASMPLVSGVMLHSEGPIVKGYAYVREDLSLRFYFNEMTGTIAFALIVKGQRIWGVDCDNRRGWHLHPVNRPQEHVVVAPLSVREIVAQFQDVLLAYDER